MTVSIGSRYTRQHVMRRDTAEGTFEEINSPLETRTERTIQLALLKKEAARRRLITQLRKWTRP